MRKIIQITSSCMPETEFSPVESRTVALCDDGTVWEIHNFKNGWLKLPPIPQPLSEEEKGYYEKLIEMERKGELDDEGKEELSQWAKEVKNR